MKAKEIDPIELRVGNVLIKDDGWPERIAIIYSNDIVKFLGFDHSTDLLLCKRKKLTEAFLLQAGFKKCKLGDNYWFEKSKKGIKFLTNDIGKDAYSEKLEFVFIELANGKEIRCKYAHKLQNLWYDLTGTELTAEPARTTQTIN